MKLVKEIKGRVFERFEQEEVTTHIVGLGDRTWYLNSYWTDGVNGICPNCDSENNFREIEFLDSGHAECRKCESKFLSKHYTFFEDLEEGARLSNLHKLNITGGLNEDLAYLVSSFDFQNKKLKERIKNLESSEKFWIEELKESRERCSELEDKYEKKKVRYL